MMAQQLWWEKSQGNLELYFAAPMNIMSVLFGMAFGGFIMASTRAAAVLVVATVVYQVVLALSAVGLPLRFDVGPVDPVDRGVLPDAGRAVRPGDGPREPVPHVGPR